MQRRISLTATRLDILVFNSETKEFNAVLIKISDERGHKRFKKRIIFRNDEFVIDKYLLKVNKCYTGPDVKVKLTFTFKQKINATNGSIQVVASSLRYEEWEVLPTRKRKFTIAELYKQDRNPVLIGEPKNKRARL